MRAAQVISDLGSDEQAQQEVPSALGTQLRERSGQERLSYVSYDLNGPTKTQQHATAIVVVFGNPRSGLPLYDNAVQHAHLLWATELLDGAWICDEDGAVIPPSRILRSWLRPMLARLAADGTVPRLSSFWAQDFTLNTMRRGGNSHAADMGAERWMRCGHGRWSAGTKGGLHMIDYYDEISLGRRLLVTACM